jgi:hypothetical protein
VGARQYVAVLTIQCDTSTFRPGPRNGFRCNLCRLFATFPRNCTTVIIVVYGARLTLVRDALSGAVLHDCRTHDDDPPPGPWQSLSELL